MSIIDKADALGKIDRVFKKLADNDVLEYMNLLCQYFTSAVGSTCIEMELDLEESEELLNCCLADIKVAVTDGLKKFGKDGTL